MLDLQIPRTAGLHGHPLGWGPVDLVFREEAIKVC